MTVQTLYRHRHRSGAANTSLTVLLNKKALAGVSLCADLDHREQALVGGGVSGDGEASGRVPGDDAVHCAPGLSVRLVFVGHGQVGDDDVDSVLVDLAKELTERRQEKCPFN